MLDRLKRRWLALWIGCPKKAKTKGDILKYALYIYLKGECYGLCYAVRYALEHYHYKQYLIPYTYHKVLSIFPLFSRDRAVNLFNGVDAAYWWPTKDWRNRYRFMKWLIKKYNNVEL